MKEVPLPLVPEGSTPINEKINVLRENGYWIYSLFLFPVYSHAEADGNSFRFIIASLVNTGLCRVCEIASAFGIGKQKVLRAVRQLKERGPASFFLPRNRRCGGTILTAVKLIRIQQELNRGATRGEIAEKFNIKRDTLRKAINDGRLEEPRPAACGLISTSSERARKDIQSTSGMGFACTRKEERFYSAVGLLNGADTVYEPSLDVPFGGVLCSLPALESNGLLEFKDTLGELSGYYRTEHILLTMAFMYLCRIRNPEQMKKYSAGEFGRLIGLDRIPEERCLRKKLSVLSEDGRAEVWSAQLAEKWLGEQKEDVGFLYVDGHVKEYSGGSKLPRRYVSRQRLCLRGISNYWVNDALGQPFFFIEKQIDPGLIKVLENEIIPRLLKDVPNQPSETDLAAEPLLHRFILFLIAKDTVRPCSEDYGITAESPALPIRRVVKTNGPPENSAAGG